MLNLSTSLLADQNERRNTISAKAYVELREAIITARIAPGANISETDVAQSLGISRTPVREAFTRLFDEGLIEISPQTGTRVSLIDMARVREAVFIRSTLESAVVANSGIRPDPAMLDEIELSLRAQERLIHGDDMGALHRADMAFHAGLLGAFAHPRAWTACQHVSADMMRIQFLIGMKPDHIRSIIAEHRAIFDEVRAGNMGEAARLMAAHIRNADLDQMSLNREHQEFFRAGEPS
ncbi:GntR family transcriptional regulator [Mesorhizobium sp. DCY119]|jgi:DNA-binding GntR family transcriptional regulator|uniref:GntR family transcriptional regulator n=1 Tax=Mesorhizobium sp. DCY119 TaxID=2108445 RepID=UPI0013C4456D|nr:GntR family transcriptional regulator [Mesorhizobium sp. DCY119]